MKIAGVIAEYNPFHNGHALHLQRTREMGATHIVAAMSGSFVQRGDAAICDKWVRAETAILGGADLVVELPAAFSLSSAQSFARAGVFLLKELGAEALSFGSECGDGEKLRKAARLAFEAEQSPEIREFLKKGMSYPRARAAAVTQLYGEAWAELITHANNLLGVEYIRAIEAIAPQMEPWAVSRAETAHDAQAASGNIASASLVRRHLRRGEFGPVKKYVPDEAYDRYIREFSHLRAPVTERSLERILLAKLRQMTPADFARLPDVSEGLENRLCRCVRDALSLEDFYMKVKTKRYTMARIRRISFCALLGIEKSAQEALPACARVLAVNRRGMEILAAAREKAAIPIGSAFAALYRKCPEALAPDVRATDIYTLAMPAVHPSGMDFTHRPVIL